MEIWAISWSGGKDSALALDRAVRAGLDVRYLATLYDPASGRVRFHGTPVQVLEMQAVALGRELLGHPAAVPGTRHRARHHAGATP